MRPFLFANDVHKVMCSFISFSALTASVTTHLIDVSSFKTFLPGF